MMKTKRESGVVAVFDSVDGIEWPHIAIVSLPLTTTPETKRIDSNIVRNRKDIILLLEQDLYYIFVH
ncbi:MAG: hypothetical protein P1Q69_21395 [Candidatus Thorarchaeota archaeon]|nr:hypothetical protein [Candidatus Thorarchaeota archaeon]